jgi:hypothetical protein
MTQTMDQVEGLQKLLDIKMVDVEEEKRKTDELIKIVGAQSLDAQKEAEAAGVQEAETNELCDAARAEKAAADVQIAEAIPAMERATDAVNCLEVKAI